MVKERVHTQPIQQKSQPFFQKKAEASHAEPNEDKQKKIKVSQQGDPYEREADKVADQVVKKQNPEQVHPPLANSISPLVQRMEEGELAQRVPEEEYRGKLHEESQKKELAAKESPEKKEKVVPQKKEESPTQKKISPKKGEKTKESDPKPKKPLQNKEEPKEKASKPKVGKKPQKKEESPAQMKATPQKGEKTKESDPKPKKPLQNKEEPKGKASKPKAGKKLHKKEEPHAQMKALPQKEEKSDPSPKKPVQKKEESTEKPSMPKEDKKLQKKEEEKPIQRKAAPTEKKGKDQTFSQVDEMFRASKGKGEPLPESLRQELEVMFGVDFSEVRIHKGANAEYMSQALKAQAFAHGKDIYFNMGKFSPNSQKGKHLLAHELTHTVQQGAAPPLPASSQSQANRHASSPIPQHTVQGFLDVELPDIELPEINLDVVREEINDIAERNVPGLSLFFLHIRYNPILGRSVQYSDRALLQGVFRLVPTFGDLLFQRLDEKGIIDDAITWVNERLEAKDLTRQRIENVFDSAWDAMDFVPRPLNPFTIASNNIDVLEREFGPLLRDIIAFATEAGAEVLLMIKDAFLEALAELAQEIEGYDVLADMLRKDPITDEERNATTADILRSILSLPLVQALGGDKLLPKLEEHNKIEETADWIDQQWGLLRGAFRDLVNIATKFLEGFSMETLRDPMGFVNEIKDDVIGFIDKITEFFGNLADKALEIIKELSLWLLDTYIGEESPYWDLIVFVFGRNPVTGDEVPRDYLKLIGAFLKLLPNGDSLYEKFIATGALQNMVDWVQNAVTEFITIIGGIKDAIVELFTTSTIEDLFEPIPFFQRIFNLFQEPVTKLLAFVKKVVIKLFEVLMDIMNIPQDVVVQIINNVISAVEDIKRDPVQFLLNLLKAVKEGFSQFFNNILTHLFNGVTDWLFGTLTEAGVNIPQTFDLPSILTMVLEILGLTMDNIWERLALKIGQERVDMIRGAIDKLTGIWNFIQKVREEGISAIWDYIKEKVSDFWTMILDKAKEWIITTIIEKVTVKLLSMLDPTGVMAVVNGFIAFYNAIQSFVEKLNEMLQIAASFTRGVAEIAKGAVTSAANFLENALADAIPVAISFLANQVGLGGLSDKIREVIQMVRDYINQGIDWLLDKAIQAMQSIASIFTGGGEEEAEDPEGNEVDSTDHVSVAERAKQDMEAPPEGATTYQEIRGAKEIQARSIERHYTDMLEPGIAMTITFSEVAQDQGDSDLDFEVLIAPNDERRYGAVALDALTVPPIDISLTLVMNTEPHTIYAKSDGNTLKFEMATHDVIDLKYEARRAKEQDHVDEPTKSQLDNIMQYLDDMLGDYNSLLGLGGEGEITGTVANTMEEFNEKMDLVRRVLVIIGNDNDINNLMELALGPAKKVQEAVNSLTIIPFLRQMASASPGNEIRDAFFEVYQDTSHMIGSKSARLWLQDKFRAADDGTHEWIPTNKMDQVIERASSASELTEGLKWIDLQHELRSDTSWVIFKPSKSSRQQSFSTPTGMVSSTILQGHPGAVKHDDMDNQVQKSDDFHSELDDNFDNKHSPGDAIDGAKLVFEKWVWKDEIPNPDILNPKVVAKGLRLNVPGNVQSVKNNQKTQYNSINTHFVAMKSKYG